MAKTAKSLTILIISIVLLIMLTPMIEKYAPDTFGWIGRGLNELINALKGDLNQGYFSYLTNSSKWVFPKGLGAIIGYGVRVMGNNMYGSASDIGVVNDIWFGGVIYTITVYALFINYCRRIRRLDYYLRKDSSGLNESGIGKYLFFSFLTIAIALNFKTFIIGLHPLSMLFIVILVYTDMFGRTMVLDNGLKGKKRRRRIRLVIGR